eukprot:scaffold22777_cov86-Skeletonema_dohrnii-CCMP3373.AAC.4
MAHLQRRTKTETTLALVPYVPRPQLIWSLHNKQRPPSCSHDEPALVSDIVPHILSYMDAITLSRASSTCRSWNRLANSNELWNELCKEKFGILASELTPPPDPTSVYVMSHLRMKEAFYGALLL